ncbi:MAG: VOC family protein [Gemmatimonadetes bacterium]|nr:VOC family protein [Gemmatimonadota bacterium]MBI3568227.1 VOC family protein [Gemmatimonadota bacterium]
MTASSRRLPDATHLGVVHLQVADLARSLRWYGDVLGFRVLARDGAVATLAAHGDDRALVLLHERAGAAPVPRNGRLGLFHYAILLPDRPSLARFVAHVGDTGEQVGAGDHLVSEAFYLHDPDGLGIEVYADRPRSQWKVTSQGVEMATLPVNVPDLLKAAGSEPWRGMPAGTVIGHVHLHVGTLPAALAFYGTALGFDKMAELPGAGFLSAGGYHHHLGVNTWARNAPSARADEARLLEWTIVVPAAGDAAEAAERLRGAGGTVQADGAAWVAHDPWGTAVRITA